MNRTILAFITGSAVALGGSIVAAQGHSDHADHADHAAHAEHTPQLHAIHLAVAAPDRPETAKALDEGRKPAEVLNFLGLEPGMAAVDLLPGAGYWSEIMGHVVAPEGTVIALNPEPFAQGEETIAAWKALEARTPGVTQETFAFSQFAPGTDRFDFAMLSLNYHDLYWESERFQIPRSDPNVFLAALYGAMKPGGIVGVIDHNGNPGDTRAIVDATHRINAAVVIADFERAGFVLEGTSDILANPDDDLDMSVFDPSIRSNTDRFVMKFVKPE